MNVQKLNEEVRNIKMIKLKKTIEEIERSITWRASNGLNDIEISTDRDSYDFLYTVDKWMFEPVKEHFGDNGYKVEIKEIKNPTKWIEKLLRIYEPQYLMIISWEEI